MDSNPGCFMALLKLFALILLIPAGICVLMMFNGCGTDDQEELENLTALSVAPTSADHVCPVNWQDIEVCE